MTFIEILNLVSDFYFVLIVTMVFIVLIVALIKKTLNGEMSLNDESLRSRESISMEEFSQSDIREFEALLKQMRHFADVVERRNLHEDPQREDNPDET